MSNPIKNLIFRMKITKQFSNKLVKTQKKTIVTVGRACFFIKIVLIVREKYKNLHYLPVNASVKDYKTGY